MKKRFYIRETQTYKIGEKVVHLEDALKQANKILNEHGLLGVLPNHSISFTESNRFHKRVRQVLYGI